MKPTIRIRIAVAIDSGGEWNANGWGGKAQPYERDAMSMARECVGADAVEYWIEAELPIPDPTIRQDGGVISVEATPREE